MDGVAERCGDVYVSVKLLPPGVCPAYAQICPLIRIAHHGSSLRGELNSCISRQNRMSNFPCTRNRI